MLFKRVLTLVLSLEALSIQAAFAAPQFFPADVVHPSVTPGAHLTEASAAESAFHLGARPYYLQTTAAWIAEQGGEIGLGLQTLPLEALSVGPRLSLFWAGSQPVARFDATVGGEGTLWFFNAFGPGFGADWVLPRGAARLESFLSLRMKRVSEEGAFSARIGASYDTDYKAALKLGLAIQLGGVR